MSPIHARLLGLLLLLLTAAMVGCPAAKRTTSDRDLQLINREQIRALLNDPDEAENLVIIDVRQPRPYAEGHIPGAINIPVIDLRKDDPRLADAEVIVVYGSGHTQDLLSWAAGKKLVALGYVGVHDFRGGMEEWLGRGRYEGGMIDDRLEDKADQY